MVRHKLLLTERILHITLSPNDYALIDILSNIVCDGTVTILNGTNSTLIQQICQVSTRESSRLFSEVLEAHIGCKLLTTSVYTQNLEAPLDTWKGHLNLTVEPTGAEQCII